MSLTGEVFLFSESRPVDMASIWHPFANWAGSDRFLNINAELESVEVAEMNECEILTHPDEYSPMVPEATARGFWSHYREGLVLRASVHNSPRADEIALAVEKHIDPAVRGKFIPYDMTISLGKYPILNDMEQPGEILGKPFLAIGFFGYGIPEDWAATRQQLQQLPALLRMQRELESIAGTKFSITAQWSC